MSKILVVRRAEFGRDTRVGARSPYVRVGLGAALAAKGPYDLDLVAGPGRVAEIKKALRFLGQKAGGAESLWSLLSDSDQWEEIAGDEFVAFTSRYKNAYTCFPGPHFQFDGDMVFPTMNGLLLLDSAYRAATGGTLSWAGSLLSACSTAPASSQTLPQLEAFLTGKTHVGESVDLAIDAVGAAQVLPPQPDATWGERVAPSTAGYSQYLAAVQAMQSLWQTLGNATDEATRSSTLEYIALARSARNTVATALNHPGGSGTPGPNPGGGGGTTTVQHLCPPGQTYDDSLQACACPAPFILDPKTNKCGCPSGQVLDTQTNTCKDKDLFASLTGALPTWAWIGAAGIGIAVAMARSKKSGSRSRRPQKRRRRR